jgi:cation:H+ antiporter
MKARAEIIQREMPVMIGVMALLWILVLDGEVGRLDGLLLFLCSIAYFYFCLFGRSPQQVSRSERRVFRSRDSTIEANLGGCRDAPRGPDFACSRCQVLITGALGYAAYFKLSEVIVGLTVVAIGTSLPELATSVVAALKKEPDVALGNAIGSNILNVLLILGITALIQPISAVEIKVTDLGVMLGSSVLLFVLLRWRSTLDRAGGAILLVGYVLYVVSLVR